MDHTRNSLQVPDIMLRTTDSFHKSNLPLPLKKLNTKFRENKAESPKVKFIRIEEHHEMS